MIEILGNNNTLLDQFIAELRDEAIQTDSLRFRRNLERIGEVFAYEISKKLVFVSKEVNTGLGVTHVPVIKDYPVLVTLLRAGLPLQQGLLSFYDRSPCGFVSSYRKYNKDEESSLQIEYVSCPDLTHKTLILSDAMMASGESVVKALKVVLNNGKPEHIHIVTVLSSDEAIENVKRNFGKMKITIWVGAIDDEITAQAFLVPGLGDAGDLAFGEKTNTSS